MTLMRNNRYAFYQQCTSLSRFFICSLYLPDPFQKSSILHHHISLFHDLPFFKSDANRAPFSYAFPTWVKPPVTPLVLTSKNNWMGVNIG